MGSATLEIDGLLEEDPSELYEGPCSQHHGQKSVCVSAGCTYVDELGLCGVAVDRPPAASPFS